MLRQSRLSSAIRDPMDLQSKQMLERLNLVEKQFSEMCVCFSEYSRKIARLCEKNDELAKIFRNISNSETQNKSLASALSNLSKALTILGDYKELQHQRIEYKVVGELTQYESFSRMTKDELKNCLAAKEKEMIKKRELEQIRQRNLRDHKKLSTIDSELKKTKLQAIRATKETETIIDNYEREKIKNLKEILLDFIAIEIKQHARSIEVLTAAYQDLYEMDDDNDVPQTIKKISSDETKSSGYLSRFRSQSLVALNSLFHHGNNSTGGKRRDSVMSHSTTSLNSLESSPKFLRKDHHHHHHHHDKLKVMTRDKKNQLKDDISSSTSTDSQDEDEIELKKQIKISKPINYKGRSK